MPFTPKTDYPTISQAFRGEACYTLDYSRDRILHCLHQLRDEQLWSRPREPMNAIGNVVLHVCGNLRQWLVAGLTDAPDTRDREAEFAQRQIIPRDELVAMLTAAVDEAKAAIIAADDDQLLRPRYIQVARVTGLGAVWHSVAHLEGHAQETIYATRLILGPSYRFKDSY